MIWLLSAGRSHRRTSGGKAEAQQAEIFSVPVVSVNFMPQPSAVRCFQSVRPISVPEFTHEQFFF
jgi:hypothetical protein